MKPYIKLPKIKKVPDSSIEKRKLSDDDWKNFIFHLVLEYYKKVDNKKVRKLIQCELAKPRSEIEKSIKNHISNWLEYRSQKFGAWGFIINLEASSQAKKEGFYDLKFQHSDWRKKYFSFEAKNLGKSKSMTFSSSIDEYVYTKKKEKEKYIEDGGMYRYFTGKYACDMDFGGMIGFVVEKTEEPIVGQLIKKIHSVYKNKPAGNLSKNEILENSISGNENTFDSFHIRKNYITEKDKKFVLHHIIMDFTN